MRGRDGTDTSYETNTLSFGAGESFDAIFTAPPHQRRTRATTPTCSTTAPTPAVDNLAPGGFGGQRTEVHVYPAGTLSAAGVSPTSTRTTWRERTIR